MVHITFLKFHLMNLDQLISNLKENTEQFALLEHKFHYYIENNKNSREEKYLNNLFLQLQKLVNQWGNNAIYTFLKMISSILSNRTINQKIINNFKKIIGKLQLTYQLKEIICEREILDIFLNNKELLFVLYSQDFITIKGLFVAFEAQILKFSYPGVCFLYFTPEILEYAQISNEIGYIYELAEKLYVKDEFEKFSKEIESFKKQRKQYCSNNIMLNALRKDDINEFLKILSQTNFDSHNYTIEPDELVFESVPYIDLSLNILELSILFGALNIFKYCISSNELGLDEYSLKYVIYSENYDIIHYTESELNQKLTFDCFIESIQSHKEELTKYIDEMENDISEAEFYDSVNAFNFIHLKTFLSFKESFFQSLCQSTYIPSLLVYSPSSFIFEFSSNFPKYDVNRKENYI